VDFWNFTLSIAEHSGRQYRLDWKKVSPLLIAEAQSLTGLQLQFEETIVYLSYDPRTANGKNLRNFAINTLDHFPGIRVVDKPRKPKAPPFCSTCHKPITDCPHCGTRLDRTGEKGIDTAIVTDMISLAWADAWEVAILVSSDRDFIPMVDFLTTKGLRVINAYFPPKGKHLARVCWANIDLRPHLGSLAR
jgi:uncharacterized LabA/DUF88 family protein